MKQKINLRLSIISLFAVVATAVGITFAYYNLFQTQVKCDLSINAQLLADTGIFQKLYRDTDKNINMIDREALRKLDSENMRITWISEDGTVIYDNGTDITDMENHLDRPEIRSAYECGSGESVRRSDTMNLNTFYYALKLDDGTILRVSTQAQSIASVFASAVPIVVIIMAVVLGVCIIIGHLLTVQLIRPINHMAENFDERYEKPAYRELEPFAEKMRSQHDRILESVKSRQDFTANVSHELKTPLTAISGYAELIENHMIDNEQEVHIAQQIRQNSNRLLSLINDIIRLSELDHTEIQRKNESINLYKLAEDICKELKVNAEQRNIELTCVGTNTLLNGDRELLTELILNLVQNAIRYNRENGWVKVKVTSDNNHPVLTVTDNGIGIPYEHQNRIFERFYRVDKSRSRETGGTGLGLAIVKHIAEIHDARIKLDSEPNNGTVITVYF